MSTPPYNDISPWIEKALFELDANRITCAVFLVPPRTDQEWWHVAQCNAEYIGYIKGRVQFVYSPAEEAEARATGKSKSNTESSAVIVFRPTLEAKNFRASAVERENREAFAVSLWTELGYPDIALNNST